MPTRSFPVGASSDRAEGEGVMRKKIARARKSMPWQVDTLLNSRGGWEDSPGGRSHAFSDQPGQNYRQQLFRPRRIFRNRCERRGIWKDGYDFTDYFRALSRGAFQEALAPAGR